MSDGEYDDHEDEVSLSEESINEDDLIESHKDYNSDVSESDDEEKSEKKEKAPESKKKKEKVKNKENDDIDDEDVDEIDAEEIEDDLEIDSSYVEEAQRISKKTGIVIDPRSINEISKPNPKIKREILVSKEKYKSSEYISQYEFCEIIGVRAEHISKGAVIYVEVESETTARDIAKKELQLGRCPYLIKRYMTPMNLDPVYIEIWDPNSMAIAPKYFDT